MIEKPLTPKQIAELREKLDNANKTIEHLTRAYNTLRERYDEEHKKYRDESERMKRTVEAVSLEK